MIGKVGGAGLDLAKPRLRRYILDHPDFKPIFEEQNELLP